ncbi:MAG TPA: phage holin family protein [Gaiellaceae bacterium]
MAESDEPPIEGRTSTGHRSSAELRGELFHQLSLLVRSDLEVAAIRRGPELRQIGVEVASGVGAATATVLALVALTIAGEIGLALVVRPWLAGLIGAAFWLGVALLLTGLDRPRRLLRRLRRDPDPGALERARRERHEIETVVRATAQELGRTLAREAAEREIEAAAHAAERQMELFIRELRAALLAPGRAGIGLFERFVRLDRREARDRDESLP